jgi:hypothetical protein
MINTSEQLGGAIGIAVLAAIEVSYYKRGDRDRRRDRVHTLRPPYGPRDRGADLQPALALVSARTSAGRGA